MEFSLSLKYILRKSGFRLVEACAIALILVPAILSFIFQLAFLLTFPELSFLFEAALILLSVQLLRKNVDLLKELFVTLVHFWQSQKVVTYLNVLLSHL